MNATQCNIMEYNRSVRALREESSMGVGCAEGLSEWGGFFNR